MANNKREYTVVINGLKQNIKDATALNDVLEALDVTLAKSREIAIKTASTSRTTSKALSDEEKAVQRLENTRKRLRAVDSETNKLQIEANIELRERTRELTRQIQISKFAEGSIREMGMTLTDLRNEYELLTEAERKDEEQGVKLLAQIQALDKNYKELRESTGNFRDSVGNYEKAIKGLGDLSSKFRDAAGGASQLASDILGSNSAATAFGESAEFVTDSTEKLTQIIALAQIAVQAYTAISRDAVIQQTLATAVDKVRALQLRALAAAQALATRNTVLARIAQAAFNLVAAANPYVLIAAALLGVVGILYSFIRQTDTAAEKQKRLNDLQAVYLDQLDRESEKLRKVGDDRIKAAERALELALAQGDVVRQTGESEDSFNARRAKRLEEVRKVESLLFNERVKANRAQRGFYGNEIRDLEKNQKEVEKLTDLLAELNKEKAKGEDVKMQIDIDFDGNLDLVKIDDAIDAVQGKIDNLGRSVKVAVELNEETDNLTQQAAVDRANRLAQDRQTAQAIADQRAEAAKQARAQELAALREGEDARLMLIKNSREQERQLANVANRRAIEDIQIRLKEETTLTARARAALNETIVSLRQRLAYDLELISRSYADRELDILRQTEDSRLQLMASESQKQREQLIAEYGRRREDLHLQLAREESLTMQERENLTEQIINLEKAKNAELARLDAAAVQNSVDMQMANTEAQLAAVTNRITQLVKRSTTGLELIDVDATRANVEATNNALREYIDGVRAYQRSLTAAHEQTLETLQEGTPEYEAEVQKYAAAQEAAALRIIAANRDIAENTKSTKDIQLQAFAELMGKISEIATEAANVVTGVVDTISMGIEGQLEQMNAQLDEVNEKYDKAKEERERATEDVESLEARLQDATGGTALAIREQLADATRARNEANREEQRLAKEKEKREADIAKKERQLKRNDLIAGIAQATANAAQAFTKALTLMWPLNLVIAPLVGGLGLAQVAVMGRQLAKLEEGGEIKGPSHAQGGVPVNVQGRPAYEAEGGEFMVNRWSYAANAPVVNVINEAKGAVSLAEIAAAMSAGSSVDMEPIRSPEDVVAAAIASMEFRPVVAVTDIAEKTQQLVEVKDAAGFN